jgi:2',3'-cyclic-nucleotide 2'-phosphodiesterase (5'-nucleotidase family)
VLGVLTSPIEVVYHADLEGQMVVPSCGEPGVEPPDYAALVGAIEQVRRDAESRGAERPVVLLGGDQIAPDLFVRGILARDQDAGARDIAAALARAGYDAIAIGNHELSTERARFERFAVAATAAGMPLVLSNLRCDTSKQKFCRYVRSEVVVERAGQKIGILAVLSPRTLKTIDRQKLDGIELADPAEAITAGMGRLRKAGIGAVVVMVQINSNKLGFDDVLALQTTLAKGDAPDALLSSGLVESDGMRPTLLIRQDGAPPLIGSPINTAGATRITIEPRDNTTWVDSSVIRPRADQRDADTARILAPHVVAYCERYGKPIGPATAAHPTTRPALLDYALTVMRRTTRAEVALVNTGFVFARAFPIAGRLTRAKLKRAMPYTSILGTVMLPGATLASMLESGDASGRLSIVGAARPGPGEAFQVNGRAIDKARDYRVATIDFVAAGGDGIFEPDAFERFRVWRGAPDVRDLVERALDGGVAVGAPASDRLLTVGIADLAADFTNTSIANTDGLGDAQLSRAEQAAVKLELVGLLQLDHPLHRWDSRLSLKFGYARTQPAGMPAAAQETLDLIQLTSLYSYRGLKHGETTSVAVPDPYSRILFESELTVPDTRTYRHAELTHTAGALFTLRPKLKLRGGAGYRTELFADGDSPDPAEAQVGRFRFVAEAGGTLDPVAVATFGDLAITFEAMLDYFMLDPTAQTEHQVRASGKLALPLLPLLFLTAGLDVFVVDREGAGSGASFDTTIGLKLHLDAAYQRL